MDAGTAEDVLNHLSDGADVIVPIANGEPVTVLDAIEANADRFDDVRIHQMHALHDRPSLRGELRPHVRHISYFLSPIARPAFLSGGLDLVPNHFSEVPQILRTTTKCTLVVAAASLPDRHGYFSLGTACDYVASLIGEVPFFLEVNPQMPRTFGENQIHVSQLVGWCEADYPLVEVPPTTITDVDRRIAAHVAALIPDGSTLQAGIGAIPNAIMTLLENHRDMGIHTELLSDGVMDLVEAGVVTGTKKAVRRGKIVTTFALGTRALYEWIHENSAVELLPVAWVNDPRVIARDPNFVSINATTEVDFLGQCASETIGGRYYSSSGGQADFARGAMYAANGKGFIVVPSTTKDGAVSRIRPRLHEGSAVTTLKNTVDHVVTEYGVAKLRGRSIRERTEALIGIAHPSFRDELLAEAKDMGFV
jgi:acyl-CoA hydrolase